MLARRAGSAAAPGAARLRGELLSNASAIPAGVIVFGDPLGADAPMVALRSLAFVLVVAAAALIPAPTRAATLDREPSKRDAATAPA